MLTQNSLDVQNPFTLSQAKCTEDTSMLREERVEVVAKPTKENTTTTKLEKPSNPLPTKDEYNSFFE